MSEKNKHKSTLQIFFIVFVAALGTFLFGFELGVFNTLENNIDILYEKNNKSSKNTFNGLINSLYPIGAVFGCILGGILLKKGRRISFIIADFISIVAIILMLIQSSVLLLIGRFIVGIAVGINSAAIPCYVNEISPSQISGAMGSMFQLMVNVGIFISFILGLFLQSKSDFKNDPNMFWWRFMLGFPIFTCIFRTLMLAFVFEFETPFFLCKLKKDEEALEVLKKIYKTEYVEEELVMIKEKVAQCEKEITYKFKINNFFFL